MFRATTKPFLRMNTALVRQTRPGVLVSSRRLGYQENPDASGNINVTKPSEARGMKVGVGMAAGLTVLGLVYYFNRKGWNGEEPVEDPHKIAGGASGPSQGI